MSRRTSVLLAMALLLALGVGLLVLPAARPALASEEPGIVYLSVTGQGPSAKAWFKGSPPSGMPVQDALDKYAAMGFRVSQLTSSQRPVVVVVTAEGAQSPTMLEESYVLVLER